jgi:hypothetical protein
MLYIYEFKTSPTLAPMPTVLSPDAKVFQYCWQVFRPKQIEHALGVGYQILF